MITLKALRDNIDNLLKKNPSWAELPLIYASDEEGNEFHLVTNNLVPTQVHDIKDTWLELVGFEEEVAKEDINCICIN